MLKCALTVAGLVFLDGCQTPPLAHHVTDSPKAWLNLGSHSSFELYWCDATKAPPLCQRPKLVDPSGVVDNRVNSGGQEKWKGL